MAHRDIHGQIRDLATHEADEKSGRSAHKQMSYKAIIEHNKHASPLGHDDYEEEEDGDEHEHAHIEADDDEDDHGEYELDSESAIESMGISAYCLFDTSGQHLVKLVLVAAQGFFLQYTILYFMSTCLVPYDEEKNGPRDLNTLIVAVAVYLHIVNTITGLPFGFCTVSQFHLLKDSWLEYLVTFPLFMIDAVVTPLGTLIIGSLYLCTSVTVSDVILNSCAVAFIDSIDDWILTLNLQMNKMGGAVHHSHLYVPYFPRVMTFMNWTCTLIPIIPASITLALVHLGLNVMDL